MWWRAEPHDLHRVTDRVSSLYVERTHIDRDENAVVLVNKERTVRVPAAFVAVLLLGPGTRITHQAVNLLGDSGTSVCGVGEHGVRMYAAGLGPSRGSRLLMRQAWLVSREKERIGVARQMYGMRFPDEDVAKLSMQQLRGREGARIKRIYKRHADRTGVEWSQRQYRHGDPHATGDDVNRLLSAGNACLYGVCHAAINGIGASPGLGFIHTGSSAPCGTRSRERCREELTGLETSIERSGRTRSCPGLNYPTPPGGSDVDRASPHCRARRVAWPPHALAGGGQRRGIRRQPFEASA
jgi:CRISPR-associated protein Cas1